jgi:hypothetical protein
MDGDNYRINCSGYNNNYIGKAESMMKERSMLEDMFFKLLHEEKDANDTLQDKGMNLFERLAFYEEFTYRTIDLMEHGKNEEAEPFIDLLEHFESIALEHNKELLCGFFFALADMLTLKFEYAKMPNEKIDREEHENEMRHLRDKFGWNNIHVINKKKTQVEL